MWIQWDTDGGALRTLWHAVYERTPYGYRTACGRDTPAEHCDTKRQITRKRSATACVVCWGIVGEAVPELGEDISPASQCRPASNYRKALREIAAVCRTRKGEPYRKQPCRRRSCIACMARRIILSGGA